jgi:hypothetical protein
MATLVWDDGSTLASGRLPVGAAAIVGRSPESGVVIPHGTVSRQHALIRESRGTYAVENLSATNTTRVNGYDIAGPTVLRDGDLINMGSIGARFHDLAGVASAASAQTCSHCGRENTASDRDCWFCGTSLVNAPTVMVNRRKAACRIAPAANVGATLFHGDGVRIFADGRLETVRGLPERTGCAAFIETPDGRPPIVAPGDAGAAQVNGEPVAAGRALAHGDIVAVGGSRFVVLTE